MSRMRRTEATLAKNSNAILQVVLGIFLIAAPVAAQNSGATGRPGQGPIKRQAPPADLEVSAAPGGPAYQLFPTNCGTGAPVLMFYLRVSNAGGSASPAQPAPTLSAVDYSLNPPWSSSTTLPSLGPGQSVIVNLPVTAYAAPFSMGGNAGAVHNFRFPIGAAPAYNGPNARTSTPLQIAVSVPAAFCMQHPPQPPQLNPKAANLPMGAQMLGTATSATPTTNSPSNTTNVAARNISPTGGSGVGQGPVGATGGSVRPPTNFVNAIATANDKATPLAAEVIARLKSNATDRKAGGSIKFTPDSPSKLNHLAVMSALQKQFQAAELERTAILSSANSSSATLTPGTATRNVPAVQAAVSGNPQVSPQPSACPASILTMNGLPVPKQNIGTPSPIKGGGIRPLGQNSGTVVVANQQNSAYFTSVPEYNLYTIRGCGFGSAQGGVLINGPYTKGIPALEISFWSDTEIVANLNPTIFGVPDMYGDVTLVVYPQGAPPIQAPGFSFYAAREEQEMYIFPASQANAQQVKDISGSPIAAVVSPQVGQYFGGGFDVNHTVAVEVDRFGTLPFSVAQDTFNFSNMLPSFYLDRYQLQYLDVTASGINTLCGDSGLQSSIDSAGTWATAWNPQSRTLLVSTEEQHCRLANPSSNFSEDWAVSAYAIAVWVVGPKGVSPWPANLL